ncbi:hypothetical protein QFC19_008784 [Naganishia cerealis]|uniref:Uncharacterized protein n=1 Tax=Naganishia cerealis TaxID=610337 RepID=A0ACC2UZR9_9TREE|nr:hypothetical protein QFC19_008784 [Naganishia cerealis]
MTTLIFLLVTACAISYVKAWESQCASFKADSVGNVQDVTTSYYKAGSLVNLTSLYTPISSSSLPAFCRVQFTVLTNPDTGKTALAELWLPDGWNQRVIGFGNGGWSGGVPYSAMGLDGIARGYASYGTDTGHQSSSRDGSWGLGNDDAIIDHGYRALHLTTVASKALTLEYYGTNYIKSYYSGCSTGGRQGLKAMASFPEDYDGVDYHRLVAEYLTTMFPSFFPPALFPKDWLVNKVIRQQTALLWINLRPSANSTRHTLIRIRTTFSPHMHSEENSGLALIQWYKDVLAYTMANSDVNLDDHYKLFTVPGMAHCRVNFILDTMRNYLDSDSLQTYDRADQAHGSSGGMLSVRKRPLCKKDPNMTVRMMPTEKRFLDSTQPAISQFKLPWLNGSNMIEA